MRIKFWAAAFLVMTAVWPGPLSSAPAGWPAALTIGTASPGGVYSPYGAGLATILTQALGLPVTAQATQGAEQNVLLVESGDAPVGFVTMGAAFQGWHGTGAWTHGKQLHAMRALFPMYDTMFQFISLKNSGIRTFADLAGKRIGVGPAGGTGGAYAPGIFQALGTPVVQRVGAWNILGEQMRSGLLDAMVAVAGLPMPMITEFDTAESVNFIALSDDQIATIRKALPELGVSIVPAGTYPSLRTEYKAISMFNFAVASKDLPDDLVYTIVKAFYANRNRMVQASTAAQESVVENLKRNTFLPYHPGAIRYYREIGAEIRADLVSAN